MSSTDYTAILTPASLLESDLAAFAKLRIPAPLLAEAGICRVTDSEARDQYGIKGDGDLSGVIFPYPHPKTGLRVTARVRRDHPEMDADGKAQRKYVLAWGDGRHLYFPPDAKQKLADSGTPICLVEAEKSVLALTAWATRTGTNILPLGLGGCWGWRGRIGKTEDAKGERVDVVGALDDLHYCAGRKVYVLLDSNAATNPKVRAARRALITALRERGASEVLVCDLPLFDGNGPDDFIGQPDGDAAMATVFDAAHPPEQRIARADGAPETPEYADDALALRFTALHGEDWRYTAPWGRWSGWDGTRWCPDDSLRVFDLARAVSRAAAETETPQIAARITSAQTVYAIERLARTDRRHAATVEQWDADPWLLNTSGGVVDLRTGELRTAAHVDYMTKITAAAPGGDCPLWLLFLARITNDNRDLQDFIQRMCGYAMTGTTQEHALFFCTGLVQMENQFF